MKIDAHLKDSLYELTTVYNNSPTKPYARFALSKEVAAQCQALVTSNVPELGPVDVLVWTADFGVLSFMVKTKEERKVHFQADLYKGTYSFRDQS